MRTESIGHGAGLCLNVPRDSTWATISTHLTVRYTWPYASRKVN